MNFDYNFERAERKRKIIDRYKRIKGCIDCGYRKDPRALEFDHLPGTKTGRTVASLYYHSWKRIKKEIELCVIRCCNCHAIRTHEQGQYGRQKERLTKDI